MRASEGALRGDVTRIKRAAHGCIHHAERRRVSTDERDVDGEIPAPMDELLGAVEGIDQEELLAHPRNGAGGGRLFRDHGHGGGEPRQPLENDLLRGMVGRGDRRLVRLVADREAGAVDLEGRPPRRHGGGEQGLDQLIVWQGGGHWYRRSPETDPKSTQCPARRPAAVRPSSDLFGMSIRPPARAGPLTPGEPPRPGSSGAPTSGSRTVCRSSCRSCRARGGPRHPRRSGTGASSPPPCTRSCAGSASADG